jgi:hypothetical protein
MAAAVGVRCCSLSSFVESRKFKSSSSSYSCSPCCCYYDNINYYRNNNRNRRRRIDALFWGANEKKQNNSISWSSHQQEFSFSLTTTTESEKKVISISFVSSISEIPSSDWDACAVDATGGADKLNPFLSHAFLSSLEISYSAVKENGWTPHHMIAKDDEVNIIVGVVPLYLKTHSYGEFVFDHSWANAYYNYGSAYYPKLQSCVPFTPVTGPRILIRNTSFKHHVFDFIISAMKDLTAMVSISLLLLLLYSTFQYIIHSFISLSVIHSPSFHLYMSLSLLKMSGTNSLKMVSYLGLVCSITGPTATTKSKSFIH